MAENEAEAEAFWEDRHRLSAIAKRTSGFKINEDVVIPVSRIPDFALFLEQLNLECAAGGYRQALQDIGRLPGMALEDTDLNKEFVFASRAACGDLPATDCSDQELEDRASAFLERMALRYDRLAPKIRAIAEDMRAARVPVASHMHAGDGNCHVNIPVNSNDLRMLETAEEAAARVMAEAQEMGGAVSGEHGIGITKIGFLAREKMDAIRAFKERQADPARIAGAPVHLLLQPAEGRYPAERSAGQGTADQPPHPGAELHALRQVQAGLPHDVPGILVPLPSAQQEHGPRGDHRGHLLFPDHPRASRSGRA